MIRTIFCNESSFSFVCISYTILNFPNPLLRFDKFFYYFSEYFLTIQFGILFRLYRSLGKGKCCLDCPLVLIYEIFYTRLFTFLIEYQCVYFYLKDSRFYRG